MKKITDDNEHLYRVYIHVNKINQKVYVGQTKEKNIKKRWGNDGIGYKTQDRFWRAIQKYGWDNFEHLIITDWITKEKANKIEIAVISLFNSTDKNYGYNISQGGNGPTGVLCTDEKKQLLSDMFSGSRNPFYGKQHTNDIKNMLSEIRSIPVVQLDLNGVFITEHKNAKEASKITGAEYTSILKCCANKDHCNSAGGYLWMYMDDYKQGKLKQYHNNHLKQVVQLDMRGNFIAEYDSIKSASKATGVCDTGIISCCNGTYQYSGGFLWKYKENYNPCNQYVYINTRLHPVVQFDLYGNIIGEYVSVKDAKQKTGIPSSNISRCCSHNAKTAGGFIWRYKEEIDEL
jgi:group I intron endonuclease